MQILGHPMTIMMYNYTEFFKYIPGFRTIYYKIKFHRDRLFGFFEKQINEHQERVDLNEEPTDYVDAYLREKVKKDQEGGSHHYR